MSAVSNNLLIAGDDGYTIERSVRLRSSASSYLNRTFASDGNRTTWTWSGWFKRGALGVTQSLFAWGNGTTDYEARLQINASDLLAFIDVNAGVSTTLRESTQVFRDASAWYHLIVAYDSDNATAGNRVKIYLNGGEITNFGTSNNPSSGAVTRINTANTSRIGSRVVATQYLDGYMTEVNFIDGFALTPDSFGEYDSITGVWKPAKYTGAYGTNGFYLNFSDNTTTTTLAEDKSGNGNNWTANNISLTTGVTYDSMTDSPTIYADGGNYCVWNAVAQSTVVNGTVTRSNGNLRSTDGGTTYGLASFGTMGVTTGKWYWEVTMTSAGGLYANIGVVDLNSPLGAGTHTGYVYAQNGTKNTSFASGGGGSSYGSSYTTGDIIGVALNSTTSEITFYKNGASQGVAYTGISGNYTPAVGDGHNATSYTFDLNCGQRPFAYTPPDGFKELHTGNLPKPEIVDGSKYFNTVLYTGTGSARSVTGVGFQPDLVWTKGRSYAQSHNLYDVVRGINLRVRSDVTTAEVSGTMVFETDGFTLGTEGESNNNGYTFAAWNWKAGGTGVSNTDGTIASTVSANVDAGFSIVGYTGTGSAATVGHGLGVAPDMVIVKNRDTTGRNWEVYHKSLGNTIGVRLNTTGSIITSIALWNNTSPTSSAFSLGNGSGVNASADDIVAYCFSEVEGYSKFGSYTGNGSADGTFVYLGFRPAFVMVKASSSAGYNWYIMDTIRNTTNLVNNDITPNLSSVENTQDMIDITSNGFKARVSASRINGSSITYIYMAFAENPFKNALAR